MEKNNQTTITAASGKQELNITREFDAPLELVWKTWTEPDRFMKWWGPKNFTCPICNIDFKVGGKYLYCMRSPEGQDFWGTGTFKEIVPMERIVYTDSFADEKGNVVSATHYGMEGFPLELQVTVTFEELNGKTKMTLTHIGIPAGQMTDLTNTGWNESFDKLAESLK
ncbi:MAG: SRPBCC domain-containing protein [Flavobacterium sp.]